MHAEAFKKIFQELNYTGQFVSPRGQKVIEIENFNYTLPPYVRFCNFKCRKLNIKYIKKEFLWYLRGDKFDSSITEYASLWKTLINKDGSINSNYGQYMFGDSKQFDNVLNTLIEDKDSRRASIVILNDQHLLSDSKDIPCTYAINFRIRDNKLNMTVRMRSQDAIYGMGNDAPTFSFIHEMMYICLKETYKDLEYGEYYHSADSFHVYEKHFKMLSELGGLLKNEFIEVDCPKISGAEEVTFLRGCNYKDIPENFLFTKWLLS